VNESYQTFTRKYRPQKFQEVLGQQSIVTTLKNAIRWKRTAAAYLFSGSRGVGKTTLARIFAKALNCQNLSDSIEPCNECVSCKEIASSRSLDVIEIDGASNRGIDDVRQINETITYAPTHGYKIYIIDEVHMLTKEAFNALLKTLEEPPPLVKFFFATTEAHKVLPTIISRCQRFDLTQISHEIIVQKLKDIARKSSRDVEEEALHLIARFSEGSLRDAECFLDQIFCFEEGPITTQILHQALGATPYEYLFELDSAIQERRLSFAFECADSLVKSGKDLFYFTEELVEHFRRFLLIKLGQMSLLPLSDSLKKEYQKNEALYTQEELLVILDHLMHAMQTLQKSLFKRASLESILLDLIRIKERISLPSLVRRLIELEKGMNTEPKIAPQVNKSIEPCEEAKSKESLCKIELGKEMHSQPPQVNKSIESCEEPKPKESLEEPPLLEKVPFSLKVEAIQPPPPQEEKKETLEKIEEKKSVISQPKSHQDTVMRFASIELEGFLEMDSPRR
jgi:DNA polymerase III subunit gamma/tau